eukprot:4411253-Alexandrium_andersonii.AAC.1
MDAWEVAPPPESPGAGGPEGQPCASESPGAGGRGRRAGDAEPSLGHALRLAWALVRLSSSGAGRQSLRAMLEQLGVPAEAALAWERRL